MNNYYNNRAFLASTAVISLTTIATTYAISSLVSKYGLSGTLRYIWEGDHLPPHVREAVDVLDEVENELDDQIKKKLKKVDMMMELARLNSVDGGGDDDKDGKKINNASNDEHHDTTNTTKMIISDPPAPLTKNLGILSHKLDKLASEVDSVQSCNDVDVKKRKKELSRKIVSVMDQVDGYIKECGVTT